MNRQLTSLTDQVFDLVVVGGGIFGICTAWDATLRGLSVALLEKGDFAHATSANCFKMVHGGVRYLQHGDFIRLRQSSQERSAFLRVAPHLVKPLPIAIPTFGHGMQGKELLGLGLTVYDLLTADRNRGICDPSRHIPQWESLSREEVLQEFPGIDPRELTGAAVFHDGQMYSPARLALAFLQAAVERGAQAANYLEATGILHQAGHVLGVKARDVLTGAEMEICGRSVVNAAGPWAERLLSQQKELCLPHRATFSRDAYFVVPHALPGSRALAVLGGTKDPDAMLSRQARHLFLVPWRDYTLVGVWHVVHTAAPDQFTVTEDDLQSFIREINQSYPPLGLSIDDVCMWNAGLTLFGENRPNAVDLSYGKRSKIIDHKKEHGIDGLITLVGVRYTTARSEAEGVVDMLFDKMGKASPKCLTASTPVFGARFDTMDSLRRYVQADCGIERGAGIVASLCQNYGSAYSAVLKYVEEDVNLGEAFTGTHVLKAEVVHAVREEMAVKLSDVVFRRTDLGTGARPPEESLVACADVMAKELKWDVARVGKELAEVQSGFPSFGVQARSSRSS
ncbi:MAG: glycerol-3-phosphate dehydrogenase/oxidase [Nitrospira sp.]|jgi:glycerol-3-phosphate dehydrogenase